MRMRYLSRLSDSLVKILLAILMFAGFSGPPIEAAPLFPDPVFRLGVQPLAFVPGDFNGDGLQDLAVTDQQTDEISIQLGLGDGTFIPLTRLKTSQVPNVMVAADFNNDGDLDLAVTHFPSDSISLLLGRGDGTFGTESTINVGDGPDCIVVGDFNADGNKDLAITHYYSNNLFILMGRGDGSFNVLPPTVVGDRPIAVAIGLFNADQTQDLVTANSFSGDYSVLLGDGNGSFSKQFRFRTQGPPSPPAVGDFNGDGLQDLAVTDYNFNSVYVLLSSGDGTFHLHATLRAGRFPDQIAVRDFNADGIEDFAVVNDLSYDVSVFIGLGDGSFGPETRYRAGDLPFYIFIADFDADGIQDLALSTRTTTVVSSVDITILRGLGDGTFGPQNPLAVGARPVGLSIADFNEDALLDLAVANIVSNDVSILLGRGNGEFQPQLRVGVGQGPVSIAPGDFNGDGHIDLAIANSASNDISVLLGQGDGTFMPQTRYSAGAHPVSVVVGDFNNDGIRDLAVANGNSGDVSILLGLGDGTFGAQKRFGVDSGPWALAVGDLDGNGVQDLVVGSYFTTQISTLLGVGDGSFIPGSRIQVGYSPTSIVVGDFNIDGVLDIATANNGSNDVSIVLGVGDGVFGLERRYAASEEPRSLASGDFNSDGLIDLAVANRASDDVSLLFGRGNGNFAPQHRFRTGDSPESLAVADFNSDGFPDLATANFDSQDAWVIINLGSKRNEAPVAVAGPDIKVECSSPLGAVVLLDGSRSTDLDSTPGTSDDIISFEWFDNFDSPSQVLLGVGKVLTVTLPLGVHVVTLQVTDHGGATATDELSVAVIDTTPPMLACPGVATVECIGPNGAPVSLVATASDACGGVRITNSRSDTPDASGMYPLGSTPVTFTATDVSGNTANCATSAMVRDTMPPVLTLTVIPTTLWPPNHRMVPVQVGWQVSDACDPAAGVALVSATSTESDDALGNGDGSTTGDLQDVSIGTPDTSVLLRAERSADGPGRVYTLTYAARDASANTSSALGIVTVPHDEGVGPEPVMMNVEADGTPGMAHLYWNAVSGAEMYDVIQGDVSQVSESNGEIWLGPVHVLTSGQTGSSYTEDPSGEIPTIGRAFFYLVQYREGQSVSGWGTESSPWPAKPSSCDIGCPGEVTEIASGGNGSLRK